MKTYKQLTEIFNTTYPYKKLNTSILTYQFETEDDMIVVEFVYLYDKQLYQLDFFSERTELELTYSMNPFKVFSTVIQIVKDNKLDRLLINANTTKKAMLYRSLLEKLKRKYDIELSYDTYSINDILVILS
jgi:hypothetical protein